MPLQDPWANFVVRLSSIAVSQNLVLPMTNDQRRTTNDVVYFLLPLNLPNPSLTSKVLTPGFRSPNPALEMCR